MSIWKKIETAPRSGRFLVTDGKQVGLAEGMGEAGMLVKFIEDNGQADLVGWTENPPLPKGRMN